MPATPEPVVGAAPDLPTYEEVFEVPMPVTPTPVPGVVNLPDYSTGFEVPLLPTPEPDPNAPTDLGEGNEGAGDTAFTIPLPPTPEPVPDVPVLGTEYPALVFTVPDTEVPDGIATDGTYFYVLVKGATEWDLDKLIKADSDGIKIQTFILSTNRAEAITYLDNYLYVADNGQWPPKILKLDPANGTRVSEFDSPETTNIRGLSNDGSRLWMSSEWDDRIFKVTTGGSHLDTIWAGSSWWSRQEAMATQGGYVFVARNDKIGPINIETKEAGLSWFVNLETIRGMVSLNGVLYIADDATAAVYKAQPPSLIEVTNTPQGMASDGTNLYVVVDGTPKDIILVLDPDTGDIINSYDAPDDKIYGLTYVGSYLYALSDQNRQVIKLNPANGSRVSEFAGPGWDVLEGITNDGTDLFMGMQWNRDIMKRDTSGGHEWDQSDWSSPLEGFRAMAYRSETDHIFGARNSQIAVYDNQGWYTYEYWSTALDNITGMTFIGDVLYIADDGGDVYKASIPTGISVTNNPKGLAYDADTNTLFILVDADPNDKILKVDPDTGVIADSFDAPSGQCDDVTFLDGYLYVVDNATNGQDRSIRKLDATNGSEVDNFSYPGGWDSWQEAIALANDGTDLLLGLVNMPEIRTVETSGYQGDTYYTDWSDPRSKSSGLAYKGSEIFAADESIQKIVKLDDQGHYMQAWKPKDPDTGAYLGEISGLPTTIHHALEIDQ